jgi:hypothetical protein
MEVQNNIEKYRPQLAIIFNDEFLSKDLKYRVTLCVVENIVSHKIWGNTSNIRDIGPFALEKLGSLLEFKVSSGEVAIPRPISPPDVKWLRNPLTNQDEVCIILANNKKLFGEDIIEFFLGLKYIKLQS